WVRRSPRSTVPESIAHEPFALCRFASCFRVSRRMAVIAAADFDNVSPTLDLLRIRCGLFVALSVRQARSHDNNETCSDKNCTPNVHSSPYFCEIVATLLANVVRISEMVFDLPDNSTAS